MTLMAGVGAVGTQTVTKHDGIMVHTQHRALYVSTRTFGEKPSPSDTDHGYISASDKTRQVKRLATKHEYLSSILGTNVEGANST